MSAWNSTSSAPGVCQSQVEADGAYRLVVEVTRTPCDTTVEPAGMLTKAVELVLGAVFHASNGALQMSNLQALPLLTD